MNRSNFVRLSDRLARLPRITVAREASLSGPAAHHIDAFGIDSIDKLIDTFEVRERAIAGEAWQSKADGPDFPA